MLPGKPQQSVHEVAATRLAKGSRNDIHDRVADETPVALVINGDPHVVMMASPDNLEDFAIGFCITENLIARPAEISYLDITPCDSGLQIHLRYVDEEGPAPVLRQRNLTGRTGCGLCGTALIEDAVRNTPVLNSSLTVNARTINRALAMLEDNQPVNKLTGAVHAAAWFSDSGQLKYIREDVGRHNALDKLVGALYSDAKEKPESGFAVITSRASYEMVTKSAFAGIPLLAAISAPTSLAIDIAHGSNITLVGFARDDSFVIYTHPERIVRDAK